MSTGGLTKAGRAVLAVVLLALVFAGAAAPSTPPPPDQATAYQQDATHDGSIADAGLTAPLTQAWSVTLPGTTSYPLIVNGTVFVTTTNSLYALNQATGATIWSRGVGATAGLTYERGRIFVVTRHGLLSALDAATGASAWTLQLPGQWMFTSAPTAVDGIVYTGGAGSGGTVYAVQESDGRLLWTGSVANGDASSPAVTPDGMYVSYSCQQVSDFDPLTGNRLWGHSGPCEGGGGTTPVVAGGHVYVRDTLGNIILSASTGAVEGSFPGTSVALYAYSIPAVANNVMFSVTGQWPNTTLAAIDGAGLGSTDWTFNADGKLSTAPLVVGGLVFVGSGNNQLYALDASTGATTWSTSVGAQPNALAAANGTLVASAGSTVVAYQTSGSGTDAPSNQSQPTVDGSADLNETKAADVGIWSGLPSAYAYQWEQCDSAGANCADIPGATGASYVPGPEAYGATLRVRVTATNGVGSSAPVDSAASPVLGLSSAPPAFSTSPVVSGEATVGAQLSTTNGTWGNSATSFAYQWQRCDDTGSNCVDIPGATGSQYTLIGDDIGSEVRSDVLASNAVGPAPSGYVPSAPTEVVSEIGTPSIPTVPPDEATAYNTDPTHDGFMADAGLAPPLTQAWSITLPGTVSYPLIADGMVFVSSNGTLYAINQATGATIWSSAVSGTLAYDRGQIFVVSYQGLLTALDAATGVTAWAFQLPKQWSFTSPPTARNGIVYTGGAGSGGTLYAVQESDGHLLWTGSVANGDSSSPAVTAQGVYVSYACQRAYDFDPLIGGVLWARDTVCSGGGGTTPVVANGHVFVRDNTLGNVILSASTGATQGGFDGAALRTYSIPAVANNVAYTVGSDWPSTTLNAVDQAGLGTNLWTFTGDGKISTAPLVVGGLVYVGSGTNNSLYALDASTGATTWSTNLDVRPDFLAAANGTLVVSGGSTLMAYRSAGDITDPPSNQSSPRIVGPADLGGLEAADVGIWSGLPSAYTYQWELCDGEGANCSDIAGATGLSYLPPPGDVGVGATLRVRIVATNDIGSSDPVESAPSTSAPLVVGGQQSLRHRGGLVSPAAAVGLHLSTTNGIWTNDPTSYAYKWQRCDAVGRNCADIAGATSPQYTTVSADTGHELRSEVRARNAIGPAAAYVPSAAIKPGGLPWPGLVRSPAVTGTAAVGMPLATDTGAWSNSPTSYRYRWQRCDNTGANCSTILNATSSQYTLVAADGGHEIRSEVLASNAAGSAPSGYAPSAPTGVVIAKPVVVTLPTISGVARVGNSLSVTTGTWKHSPTQYTYQWFRCDVYGLSCKKIVGATTSSYLLIRADAGHKLVAKVTATNVAGSKTAASKPSAKILR